jgi:hypothetical protein
MGHVYYLINKRAQSMPESRVPSHSSHDLRGLAAGSEGTSGVRLRGKP